LKSSGEKARKLLIAGNGNGIDKKMGWKEEKQNILSTYHSLQWGGETIQTYALGRFKKKKMEDGK